MEKIEKRKTRKLLQGKVISNNSNKTISIIVETYKNHLLYKKRVRYSKKYLVHDENNLANIGDEVIIMETRPLSKRKHFRLVSIAKKAII